MDNLKVYVTNTRGSKVDETWYHDFSRFSAFSAWNNDDELGLQLNIEMIEIFEIKRIPEGNLIELIMQLHQRSKLQK